MNFLHYKELIEDGDTVIIYLGITNVYAIKAGKGQVFQTKYGALRHDDMIGKPYGSVINCSKGWLHVLFPTPELWTLTLPHRTQILYTPDISMIITQLELKPGHVVCEAGTGSGSLSHAIARIIAPNGHLYTFDFHEQRAAVAGEEFASHGLSDIVTAQHRDVCQQGFGLTDVADAVFLDLPHPWEVVASAKEALKKSGGRFSSFSPCIEQVQRTCLALEEFGFSEIVTYENVLRPHEIKEISMPAFELCKDTQKGVTPKSSDITNEDGDDDSTNSSMSKENERKRQRSSMGEQKSSTKEFFAASPLLHIAGHTGFLTFATLYPFNENLCTESDNHNAEADDK